LTHFSKCCILSGKNRREEQLKGDALEKVLAPTLLIVGGEDRVVIGLNEKAYDQMNAEKGMEIIPGATHLFEESGTLEEAARLAAEWFKKHLLVGD
jgi:putative phosphoribosyl transferase